MKQVLLAAVLLLSLSTGSVLAQTKLVFAEYHQTAKTKFIETGGIRYAYRILGDKTGIPLILLQGSFFTMDEWDPTITDGLAQNYKTVLFDNRGVGASGGKTPSSIAEMAKDAISFIKAMGYTKVNLLGYSMGGMITQQILLDEPELVNKIILVSTGPKGSEGLDNLGKTLTGISALTPFEQLLYLLFTPSMESQDLGKQSLGRMFRRTVDRDPATTNETNGAQVAAVLGWAQVSTDTSYQLKGVLQPAFIVEGRYDLLVPVVNSFNLYQNLPNARLSLYPDAGHGSIFQYPFLFLSEAIPFLKG